MNQLANVVIAASKLKAGSGTTEASNVFQLWRSLVGFLFLFFLFFQPLAAIAV